MTPDGVYENEMARPIRTSASDEEWPAGDPTLANFAEDLRIVASGPAPEPRPGLLAVMRQGPSVPIDSPHATGRKKMLVKTLLGSLAAKVALGAGVAAASVTAAGAAGVLPAPAQEAVASIVAAATPFSLPDPSDVTLQVVDDPSGSTTTTLAGGDDGESYEDGTAGRTVNHGACVSAGARDKAESEPGSHGRTVSSIARGDCGKDVTGTTSTTVASSTTTSSTSTTVDGERTANSGPSSANSGRGNGGSSGNGNSGNGGNRGNANGGDGNGNRGSSGRN